MPAKTRILPALAATLVMFAGATTALAQELTKEEQRERALSRLTLDPRDETNAALHYYRIMCVPFGEAATLVGERRTTDDWIPDAETAKALENEQGTLVQFIRASKLKECAWGTAYFTDGFEALLPALGKMRSAARMLSADARRLASQGESRQAAERIAAMYRISDHVSREQILIGSLVGVAITAMANGEVKFLMDKGWLDSEGQALIVGAAQLVDCARPERQEHHGTGDHRVGRHLERRVGAEERSLRHVVDALDDRGGEYDKRARAEGEAGASGPCDDHRPEQCDDQADPPAPRHPLPQHPGGDHHAVHRRRRDDQARRPGGDRTFPEVQQELVRGDAGCAAQQDLTDVTAGRSSHPHERRCGDECDRGSGGSQQRQRCRAERTEGDADCRERARPQHDRRDDEGPSDACGAAHPTIIPSSTRQHQRTMRR